jgi:hypothetical protein
METGWIPIDCKSQGLKYLREKCRTNEVAQKRYPHGPIPTRSILMVFQSAKVLQKFLQIRENERFEFRGGISLLT